jgi:4-hydroxybenzoate polyprenyltransferase
VALLVGNYLYSTPPLRLKERPGVDVLTNAVGVGVLAPIGGWAIAKDVWGFPPEIALLGFLVVVALYIPTTLVDADADLEAGYTTFATRFTPRWAYRVGLVAWLVANAGVIVLAATNTVFPERLLSLHLVTSPLMVLEYALLIGRPLTGLVVFRGLVILSWTFLLVNADFALVYGGLWV